MLIGCDFNDPQSWLVPMELFYPHCLQKSPVSHNLTTVQLPCPSGRRKTRDCVFFLHFELSLVASHFYVGLTFVILKYVNSCLRLFKYVYSCQIPNLLVRHTIHLFGDMSLLVKYWNTVISLGWGKTLFWTYQLFVFPWVLSIQPNLGSVGSTNFRNFSWKMMVSSWTSNKNHLEDMIWSSPRCAQRTSQQILAISQLSLPFPKWTSWSDHRDNGHHGQSTC